MRKIGFLIVIIMLQFKPVQSKLLMEPYLQAVSDSSIIVMAETDNVNNVTVNFGLDSSLTMKSQTDYYIKTSANKPTYVHRIILKGLKNGTYYFYKAVHENTSSSVYKFKTAVIGDAHVHFSALGDFRSNPDIFGIISNEVAKNKPDFSVYDGDLCFNADYKTWKSEFFIENQKKLISCVPFFNAIGNHEGWKDNTKAFQQSPSMVNFNSPYYSFDYGNIHFVFVSNETNLKPGSEQYNFIKNDLEKSPKTWKIVVCHKPAYCWGGHGNDNNMLTLTKEVFEPNKVDFVLAGHTHFYQHNLVKGIRHIVLGGGGAPLYDTKNSEFTIKTEKAYNFAIFDVEGKKLKMTVYDIYGKVLDSLELTK